MHQAPEKVEGDGEQIQWRTGIAGRQKPKRSEFGSASSQAASFGSCLSAAGCKPLDFGSTEPPEFLRPTCEECGYDSQSWEFHKATSEHWAALLNEVLTNPRLLRPQLGILCGKWISASENMILSTKMMSCWIGAVSKYGFTALHMPKEDKHVN